MIDNAALNNVILRELSIRYCMMACLVLFFYVSAICDHLSRTMLTFLWEKIYIKEVKSQLQWTTRNHYAMHIQILLPIFADPSQIFS